MEINILHIPDFLKDSEFYKNLDLDSDAFITIPKLKMDNQIKNIEDFNNLFETLSFFGVKKYPEFFIKYYQNNSFEVFDSLNENLLKELCDLKINNYKQFFVTYKIIKLYKLNAEKYDNYIDYALNFNDNNLVDEDYSVIKSKIHLIFFDKDYVNFIKKIQSTKILELVSYEIKDCIINLKIKNLTKKWELFKTIISKKALLKIVDAIENNYNYEYEDEFNLFFYGKNVPSYKDNTFSLMFNETENIHSRKHIETIKINEFNKKYILKEFKKITSLFWIN